MAVAEVVDVVQQRRQRLTHAPRTTQHPLQELAAVVDAAVVEVDVVLLRERPEQAEQPEPLQ